MKFTLFVMRLFALLFIVFPVFSQSIQDEHTAKFNRYNELRPQEKLFVHLDKPFYAVSDNIWFNAYLVDAKRHQPSKEALAYIELIDAENEVIAKRNVQILNGTGFGDFDLSSLQLEPGEYTLRGYTNYMRNFDEGFFFKQQISLVRQGIDEAVVTNTKEADIKVDFFPEGGELVAGQLNFLAFKVTGDFDSNDQISGVIYDEEKQAVAKFRTEKFGMGLVPVKPQKAALLKAVVDYKGKTFEFQLPEILQSGYTMSVRNTGKNLVLVANHTDPAEMKSAFIIIHQRGQLLSVISEKDRQSIQNSLKIDELPAGIVSFTLFDGDGIPRRERIVFIENDNLSRQQIGIELNKSNFNTRDKVSINLQSNDESLIEGSGSISITNLGFVPENSRESNLLSYLLLSSDIKGEIENPAYYFDKENTERLRHLDMLMLTQGWRRFVWKEVLDQEDVNFNYAVEKGITVNGQLVDYFSKNKARVGEVRLNILESPAYSQKVMTDDKGMFSFSNLVFGDTVTMVFQSRKYNSKKDALSNNNNQTIKIIEKEGHPVTYSVADEEFIIKERIIESYIDAFNKIAAIDSAYDFSEVYLLSEFAVEGRRETKLNVYNPFRMADALYGKPSKRVVADSMASIVPSSSLFDFLRTVPGVRVQVLGTFLEQTITIRGVNSINAGGAPTILVDGVETSMATLNSLPASNIAFVDVFTGADAAIFGSRGSNGLISIFTRENSGVERRRPVTGINNFRIAGYSLGREFYTPDYSVKLESHKKPDLRSTLYWNPEIDFSAKNPVEFYTSDEKGTYLIQLEGITSDGKVVLEEQLFEVR
ncbi:MAG: TonB-dependent receptor plug domain-containing protein [Bacteroidota bacterium]